MKYIFDTTTYSELLRGHQRVATIVNEAEIIYIPNVVMAELKYGFNLGSRLEDNEKLLSRFVANKKVHILLPDNATTDYFVNIAIFARKKGVQLSTHDVWIASFAEQWGAILLTFDKDFKHLSYSGFELELEK